MTIKRLIFLASLVLTGFTTSAKLEASAYRDLEYYLPPGEVVWLSSGEYEYLLLERSNEQPFLRGNILFVPEWNTHPLQSIYLSSLYQVMPDYGWNTFALQPPIDNVASIPWSEAQDRRFPEPTSEDTRYPFKAKLQDRMETALAHISSEPGATVWVVEGISAGFLLQLLHEEVLPPPDALIIVGIYLPQWQLNEALAELIAQLSIPVLDLTPEDANSWVLQTQQKRVRAARRLQHLAYRQRILPRQPHAHQGRLLQHHVYGWLSHEGF